MEILSLNDRNEIVSILRQDPDLHLYELGDLDDFFWPQTAWYTLPGKDLRPGEPRPLALWYTGEEPPVLLALGQAPHARLARLLRALLPHLPAHFYAHLSGDLAQVFQPGWRMEFHGLHQKMTLRRPEQLLAVDPGGAVPLSPGDLPAVLALYAAAYPGNWFAPRLLETGRYFGIWRDGTLVSVSGVHVYSPQWGVAVLGNITTHPAWRGQGLGTAVSAALCRVLLDEVELIGLNVKAENISAIRSYTRLGFQWVADYGEYSFLPVEKPE